MRQQLYLRDLAQAHASLAKLWLWLKPMLADGQRFELVCSTEVRSSEQNAKLHAELSDIAASREWAGAKRDIEVWKRLLTAAWLRARGESIEILPALDGHGVDVVFRRTSGLTRAEMAELIEYVQSWRAEQI